MCVLFISLCAEQRNVRDMDSVRQSICTHFWCSLLCLRLLKDVLPMLTRFFLSYVCTLSFTTWYGTFAGWIPMKSRLLSSSAKARCIYFQTLPKDVLCHFHVCAKFPWDHSTFDNVPLSMLLAEGTRFPFSV